MVSKPAAKKSAAKAKKSEKAVIAEHVKTLVGEIDSLVQRVARLEQAVAVQLSVKLDEEIV